MNLGKSLTCPFGCNQLVQPETYWCISGHHANIWPCPRCKRAFAVGEISNGQMGLYESFIEYDPTGGVEIHLRELIT